MDIQEFFESLMKHYSCQSISHLYDRASRIRKIEISKRVFQAIYSGERKITFETFPALFSMTPPELRKIICLLFFEQNLSKEPDPTCEEIMQYLRDYLAKSTDKQVAAKMFESHGPDWRFYTEEEMNFLMKHQEAFKFFSGVHVRGDRTFLLNECPVSKDVLSEMVRMGLLGIEGEKIVRAPVNLRIPVAGNSSPALAETALKFSLSYGTLFNAPIRKQELTQAVVMLTPESVELGLDKIRGLRDFLRAHHQPEQDSKTQKVAVCVAYFKVLSDDEI
jgi:hypothetical protein